MGYSPPQAFYTAFIDFWNVTAAYRNGDLSAERFMVAAKQAHDTMEAVVHMTFWSMMTEVKDSIPDDTWNATMREMADEANGFDGLTPEEKFHKMVELIENTQTEIIFNEGEE